MSRPSDAAAPAELTAAQAHAATHSGGPLLVLGAAGTGKTTVLVARLRWLVSQGAPPESILALSPSSAAAAALRRRIEDTIDRPYEELAVHSVRELCARLLRDEIADAGVDPFFAPVTRADRLALLLDRIDDLHLRRHDIGGRPAVLLAGVIDRIDRLKDELVSAQDYAAWADGLPAGDDAQRARAAREVEFAQLYLDHDRLLAQEGALDAGELVLRAIAMLRAHPHVRARVAARYRHVLVDELADLGFAPVLLVELLAAEHGNLTAAADDDQAARRLRGAATKNVRDFQLAHPDAEVVCLERSQRCPGRVLDAARAVVSPIEDRLATPVVGAPGGSVRFWRAADERAQAQAVATEVERLVRAGCEPERIGILVRSLRDEARELGVALEERAIGFRTVGEADFFAQTEVRDVLAWLRLLADPNDAGAVVRALGRPPVGLRSVDLARCVQSARRRRLDMVSALVAATESPQLPPEARERIHVFLRLYRESAGTLDSDRPDLFVHRLIERLGLRRQQVFSAQADVVERLVHLARLGELASSYARRAPHATPRDFARYAGAVAETELRDEDGAPPRAGAVQVMSLDAAPGRELDWVFVLGLTSARMPGARLRAGEPIPDALLREALGPDDRAAHVASMRRLLHVAMTRASRGLV
ncbi:MAG: ATP-dependent helicase UvrD/PcrA, partial [Solirubrobacteraceae bacterium]|nr:ATP-dependent helicase UvrD/PcrA [Solirubrobacteraceae bacterium]